jgi:hypothetical protein
MPKIEANLTAVEISFIFKYQGFQKAFPQVAKTGGV